MLNKVKHVNAGWDSISYRAAAARRAAQNTCKRNNDAVENNTVKTFIRVVLNEFWGLLKLNVLFILISLPIITLPVTLTSLCKVTIKMIRQEGYNIFTDYFTVFKREFWRSMAVGWPLILGIVITFTWFWFYLGISAYGVIYLVAAVLMGMSCIILLNISYYIFPMLAIINLRIREIWRNSILLCFAYSFRNLLLSILVIGLFVLTFFKPIVWLPVWILILISFLNIMTIYTINSGIKRCIADNRMPS